MMDSEQPDHQIKLKLASEILHNFGRIQFKARGFSMLPSLWPGDVLTVERASFDEAQPGQVVVYQRYGHFFVHRMRRRVVLDGDTALITRGDAMPQDDDPVLRSEWMGAVTGIVRDGRAVKPALNRTRTVQFLGWLLSSNRLRGAVLRLRRLNSDPPETTLAEVYPA